MQEQQTKALETVKCCICIDKPSTAHIDNCSHVFCLRCIRKWSEKKNTCPLCRSPFLSITSKRRTYKVEPPLPKPLTRIIRTHQHHTMTPQTLPTYVPFFFSPGNYYQTWNGGFFVQNQFNGMPIIMNGIQNQAINWMQPTFILQ